MEQTREKWGDLLSSLVGLSVVHASPLHTPFINFFRQYTCITLHPIYLISHILDISDQHMYLGVLIHKSLSWSPYISNVVNKASRTLNFLKRNLNKCSKQVKESAYLTMVRPQLEYASAVWDPYHVGDIS